MNPFTVLSQQLHIISFKRALGAIILFTVLWIFIFGIMIFVNLDSKYDLSSGKLLSGVLDLVLNTAKFQAALFITPVICTIIIELIYQLIQFKWGRVRFTLLENIIGISFIPTFLLIFALPLQFITHRYVDASSSFYSLAIAPADKFVQISLILWIVSILGYLIFRASVLGSFRLFDKYSKRKITSSEIPALEVEEAKEGLHTTL